MIFSCAKGRAVPGASVCDLPMRLADCGLSERQSPQGGTDGYCRNFF